MYGANGVKYYLIADAEHKKVEVLELTGNVYKLTEKVIFC